ncbi:MAG: BamA/TamA family outer membrane protein [Balneolaceae bacterium]|nr:BamA/TamA family outer membrane protein [Balneolaceae bacterium]
MTICLVLAACAALPSDARAQPDREQVWSLAIEGNEIYSDLVLKNQLATVTPNLWEKLRFWNRGGHPLVELDVRRDVIRLRNYYRRRGFINVRVNHRVETLGPEWKKRVVFTVDEQVPVTIREVDYHFASGGNDTFAIRESRTFREAVQRHAYRPGMRYESIREPEVIGRFNDLVKNMGYAFSQVSVEARIDSARLTADVILRFQPGPRTYYSDLRVEGNETVSDAFVTREAGLEEGEAYSLTGLQDAQQELFNHHLFRFATISLPEQPQDSTLELLVRLRENPLRTVEVSAGFGNEEKLRGQLSWIHRNAFGEGHRFTASARASFLEQTLGLDYLFPYVYNTKSSIVISPFAQHLLESGFELFRAGLTNTFLYRYNQHTTGSATYQFTRNLELTKQFDASLPDSTQEYDLSTFQVSAYYNESLGRDQEGWFFQPYAEVSGPFGLATYNFQKISFDLRRFTRLTSSTMLATRVQVGALRDLAADSLPNNIRFFQGGTNSVRGWNRQQLGPKRARTDSTGFLRYIPTGGGAMMGFNIEIRQDLDALIRNLGVAAFLDGGQVWNTLRRLDSRPLQLGVGGGLRYRSPLGPLRVDIGYKLNPTDEDLNRYRGVDYGSAWDRIGIHFSIGQAF